MVNKYYKHQLYMDKLGNVESMEKFFENKIIEFKVYNGEKDAIRHP